VGVGIGFSWGSEKPTELAIGVTDICWIEMPVDVEVRDPTVSSAPNHIGEFAERWQIVSGIKIYTINERQSLAVQSAVRDANQFFIVRKIHTDLPICAQKQPSRMSQAISH
jgi:hypothetical protein